MKIFDIQNSFFNDIVSNDKNQNIYKELVFIRFENVIKSSLPTYCNLISDKYLFQYIKEFIEYGSTTYFISKVPFEFANFLEKTGKINTKKIKDILYFDLVQIKIYFLDKKIEKIKFNQNKKYKLSQNIALLKTKFDIFNQKDTKNYKYILIYKNIIDYDVYYMQITKTIYIFLKMFRNKTIKESIFLTSKQVNINYKELENILLDMVKKCLDNGFLV